MRTARATAALCALVLPHLLVVLVAGLVLWLVARSSSGAWVLLALLVLALLIGAVWLALRSLPRLRVPGTLLPELEQPRLWTEVRLVSRALGVRPPDEMRLVPEARIWISDEYRWLLLRVGRRRLFIGAPLLMGLTGLQLRALLIQHLGRFGSHDGRGDGFLYAMHNAMNQLVIRLDRERLLGRLMAAWTRPFRVLTRPLVHSQTVAADRASVEAVGRDNAVGALRELGPLATAWNYFLTTYADLGVELGVKPDNLFGGFRDFLADPERRRQLDRLRVAEGRGQQPAGWRRTLERDTRADLMTASTEDPGAPDPSGPALAVLVDPDRVLRQTQDELWPGLREVSWPELAALSGAATVTNNAEQYLTALAGDGGRPALTRVLSDVRSGRSPGAGTQLSRVSPQRLQDLTIRLVGDLVAALAIGVGQAEFRPRWGGPIALTDVRTGEQIDPWFLVGAAWNSVEGTRQLREQFVAWGLDLEAPISLADPVRSPTAPAAAAPVAPVAPVAPGVLAAIGPVTGHHTHFVLVQHDGLLLVGDTAAALSEPVVGPAGHTGALADLLSRPGNLSAARLGSEVLPWSAISTVRLIRDSGLAPVLAVILNNKDSRILTLTADGQIVGDVDRALGQFLQDRYIGG